jgi:hypothetical protein
LTALPPSSIKVKERVVVYLHPLSRPSRPVLGRNLLFYFTLSRSVDIRALHICLWFKGCIADPFKIQCTAVLYLFAIKPSSFEISGDVGLLPGTIKIPLNTCGNHQNTERPCTYISNMPVYHCVVSVQHDVHIIAGVHNSQVRGRPGDYSLYGGTKYLWALSTELASWHPSGA